MDRQAAKLKINVVTFVAAELPIPEPQVEGPYWID